MNNNIACLRKIPFVHLLVNGFLCSERKSIKSFCLLASKRLDTKFYLPYSCYLIYSH